MAGPEDFMLRAIALAVDNVRRGKGGPFGAVVVKDGLIVAEGSNLVTSTNDPTAHAEIVAIRAACETLGTFQLTGCEIYASSEPCPMCMGAIYWARPARIYYAGTYKDAAEAGFDDSFIYRQSHLPPVERSIPTFHILHEEGKAPFREWAESSTKVPY